MIDLARAAPFELGPATIRPATREIAAAGAVAMIEPKVMQMLVALARNPGQLVPRDELIDACWGGRIVGEDAINRVIGKLRRAAEGPAAGSFRIETVARVGLRLQLAALPAPQAAAAMAVAPSPPGSRRSRLVAVAGGIAVATAVAIAIAIAPRTAGPSPPGKVAGLPAAVTDLETRGLSAMFENSPEQTAEGTVYLRQATVLAPRSAPVWGSLAMSYVLSLGWVPPAQRDGILVRVRDAAAHSHAIDPREARAAAALVAVQPTFGHWREKAAALDSWTRRIPPDNGPLLYQRIQFLLATGKTREAAARMTELARASPLVPWIQAARIDLLAATGRAEEADRAAAGALGIWPRDPLIWFAAFDLAAFNGRPERALAMVADRQSWPRRTAPEDVMLAGDMVRAMQHRLPAEIDAVLGRYRARSSLGHAHAERAMRAAAALERPEEALAMARLLLTTPLVAEPRATMLPNIGLADDGERPTAALFLPPAQLLWLDPGFLPLMARIGLVDYWRVARPPELCRTTPAAPVCEAVTRKRIEPMHSAP